MTRIIKTVLFALFLNAVFSATTQAATLTAASCNRSDVQAAINQASLGSTVAVPAGTCSWSGGLSISGIQLVGAGKSASGTVITSGNVAINKHASQPTRVSGFRFTGSDEHITVGGSTSARAYIIDNNYFNSGGANFVGLNANGGLLHHNDFFMSPSQAGGPDVFMIHPNEDWSQPTTFGTADTQGPNGGERNIYFEDNTFTNILETAPDGDQGARVVLRHNTYVDSSIVFHSGAPNDTSTDGTRQFEVYNNTFQRVACNNNVNKWIWVRGGSGVIANNAMDVVNTSCFGNKVEIQLGVGCPAGYPVPHQIGQTSASPQSPPPLPLLIFGNTGAGAADSNFISIQANNTGGGGSTGCGNPGAFVQLNRDYYTSNHWNWTPFTYPHPLTGSALPPLPPPPTPTDTTPPSAPTNLSATAASSQINLSWTASTDNFGVTGYNVERCQGSSCSNFGQIGTTPSGASYFDAGLTANTTYRYRVSAADAAGNLSAYSNIATATTPSGATTPTSLPTGNNGIAALYPGDANIRSNPAVIFADDFESYSSASQLSNNWNNMYQQQFTRIATEPGNVFSGSRALEFRVPQQSAEVANAVIKNLSPTEDTVFVRVYTKLDAGYNVVGSNHNGIAVKSQYSNPGVPADGTNKFYVDVENSREDTSIPIPGFTRIYTYNPEQRSQWGDLWNSDGTVLPFDSIPGNFGPNFIPRPNFLPQLNRWYSYELMVKANTPGQRDGRIAVWIDGNLVADFLNVRLRDVSTLKIDQVELGLHIFSNTIRQNLKWYDNVVVARSYIGPMSVSGAPAPIAPPTNLTVTVH